MANRDYSYIESVEEPIHISFRNIVHAMFPDPDFAARALGALLDIGVQADDVSVMLKDLPQQWVSENTGLDLIDQASQGITVTTPGDATVGAMKGAGYGLGFGALAALASIVLPGVGIVLGGGALASAIGAAIATGAAGAVAGAVVGYLKDQGVSESVALVVESDYEMGGALLSVSAPSGDVSEEDIKHILAKYQDRGYIVQAHGISQRMDATA